MNTASRIYHAARIPGHPIQVAACARVLMWMYARHPDTIRRHEARLMRALKAMERAVRGRNFTEVIERARAVSMRGRSGKD
jgi:hypothetical protein